MQDGIPGTEKHNVKRKGGRGTRYTEITGDQWPIGAMVWFCHELEPLRPVHIKTVPRDLPCRFNFRKSSPNQRGAAYCLEFYGILVSL